VTVLGHYLSPLELILLGYYSLLELALFSRTPLEVMLHYLVDNISVKASIAAFNLLPVLRNGVAAVGFFNASVSSSRAVDALSADAAVGMLYFSGKNTTVSETLVPFVLGMKKLTGLVVI
jgi:hypothetical protein